MRPALVSMTRMRSEVVATAHEEVGVLGVDDQPFFLDVVREVVAATAGFRWLGGRSSGEDALGAIQELHPRLVLLDVRMPDMDGLQAIPRIREGDPDVAIIVLSGFSADRMSSHVLERGADGYVEKGTPMDDLRDATRTAVAARRGD